MTIFVGLLDYCQCLISYVHLYFYSTNNSFFSAPTFVFCFGKNISQMALHFFSNQWTSTERPNLMPLSFTALNSLDKFVKRGMDFRTKKNGISLHSTIILTNVNKMQKKKNFTFEIAKKFGSTLCNRNYCLLRDVQLLGIKCIDAKVWGTAEFHNIFPRKEWKEMLFSWTCEEGLVPRNFIVRLNGETFWENFYNKKTHFTRRLTHCPVISCFL